MPYVGQKPADIISTAVDTVTGAFSGNVDVDGTTNLDVVDIDGAVDMASTLNVTGAITSSAGASITTDGNTAQLTLTSTDADAGRGAMLDLVRNSASPADNDLCGTIRGLAKNDAGQDVILNEIIFRNEDVTDGTEDGQIIINCIRAGAQAGVMKMASTETIMNYDQVDLDFRVASDNNANMLFVDGGNNRVGIGTTSPVEQIHSMAGGTNALRVSGNSGDNQKVEIGYDTTNGAYLKSGSSGTTTLQFYVDNTSLAMSIASNDVISGDFNDTSDVALKENITDLESATTKLKQLKPRTFDWKKIDKENGVAGFIAQEVETIIPKAVVGTNYENSGDAGKAINTTALLSYAIKTIQELEARITTLENA